MRRGAAMPWVLTGMGLSMLVAVLAWNRAWSHRERAAILAARWQAQLLAESALACAEDQLWARRTGPARPDTARDTAKVREFGAAPTVSATDSAAGRVDSCPTPPGVHGTMVAEIGEGALLAPVRAVGTARFGRRDEVRAIRAVLGGSMDRELFDLAVSQWTTTTPPLDVSGSYIVGNIRVRVDAGSPPSGMSAQPRGRLGITAYVPESKALDTAVLQERLKEAFRRPDAMLGSAWYGPSRGLPGEGEIVHTSFGKGASMVVLEAPRGGAAAWTPPARTLLVEGDVAVRGDVHLEGWTILARGQVSLERGARLRDALLYAERGVVLMDDARFQGQILSFGAFSVLGESRILGPSVALCWGSDSSARVLFDGTSRSRLYLVALGGASIVEVARDALVEGVLVSGGTLKNSGRIHGAAVAGRFDCGRGATSCTGWGEYDRSKLPPDFAIPLGLPGAKGLRVASWEVE